VVFHKRKKPDRFEPMVLYGTIPLDKQFLPFAHVWLAIDPCDAEVYPP
jgi:hypothetical protein